MKRIILLTLSAAALISYAALTGMSANADSQAQVRSQSNTELRIGTYDSRAIAIAYAHSKYNPVGEKMKVYKQAKKNGDTKLVKECEEWGEKHQRQLHRQGFGRIPVDDLLEHVKDQLPAVAQQAGVDAIVFDCNFNAEGVEVIDITMELAMLFDPPERALKSIKEIKNHDPVDLDDLDHDH